jgi:hypothetical protein
MQRARAIGLLAAACALIAAGAADLRAATDDELGKAETNKSSDPKDIRVIIPSYSRDVDDNGCRRRSSSQERFSETDADIKHVRFEDLISEVIGRYSVRAGLDEPATFMASLAQLDGDMRTLVLLDVLHDGLGRDGLHTFFFMRAGAYAPTIADVLKAAGLEREHAEFRRAMALFGPAYPVDEEARAKYFSYSSLDTPMNDFDRRMMEISRAFGSRGAFAAAMVAFVERTPALWQRIETERSKLGEVARLRYLNQALLQRLAVGRGSDADIVARLNALPIEQRTLLAMEFFNTEFSNGGVHQFFLNSSGAVAPEVYDAFRELGLERQAAIYKRGLDMFGAKYLRDTQMRQAKHFDHGDWNDWDKRLSDLTDEFYALDGGPTVVRLGGGAGVEGGPGIWSGMAIYARAKKMLPC